MHSQDVVQRDLICPFPKTIGQYLNQAMEVENSQDTEDFHYHEESPMLPPFSHTHFPSIATPSLTSGNH